jgi:hypothetical protein
MPDRPASPTTSDRAAPPTNPSGAAAAAPRAPSAAGARRRYEPPRLRRHGDVRSNVLGPSAGPSESLNFNTHEV